MINKKITFFALFSVAFIVSCASDSNMDEQWKCEAKKLNNARYNGSDKAYIHLSGYRRGSYYNVTKSADGRTATGLTKDKTPFTCTKL